MFLAKMVDTRPDLKPVIDDAIRYLREEQESDGSWFGRWGTNYIYGTWSTLLALEQTDLPKTDPMYTKAAAWLKSVQRADGGWGEDNLSYHDDKAYRGRYHVLNGALSPMSGIGPGELRMRELFERVDTAASSGSPIREVIIATNPSPEGDVTLLYLQERLGPKVATITSMARGLPFGADLQYADAVTISRSLEERRGVE